MNKYDHILFMTPECDTHYNSDLSRIKLLPKIGICFDNMPKNLISFHDKIKAIVWWCFPSDPYNTNEQWVSEFYDNISKVYFSYPSNMTSMIRGK